MDAFGLSVVGLGPILSVEDRVLVRKLFCSGENVRKSSGLPNSPEGSEGLGTSELQTMHVLNPTYIPTESSRKSSASMGRPMPKNH